MVEQVEVTTEQRRKKQSIKKANTAQHKNTQSLPAEPLLSIPSIS